MAFSFLKPRLVGAHPVDQIVGGIGTAICLALTVVICSQLPFAHGDLPVIVAPLGASAVLIFAVPASPLAQPWPVVGGNILSTCIGVATVRLIPDLAVAAGVAVALAIVVMSLLRCLHPPGGAAALTAVIGSSGVQDAGYAFALAPVGINSIVLVSLAMVFHRVSGHAYPHARALAPPPASVRAASRARVTPEDIDAALANLPDALDIGREDLRDLLIRVEAHAARRAGDGDGDIVAPPRVTPASPPAP